MFLLKQKALALGEAILLLSFNPISPFLNGRSDILN